MFFILNKNVLVVNIRNNRHLFIKIFIIIEREIEATYDIDMWEMSDSYLEQDSGSQQCVIEELASSTI